MPTDVAFLLTEYVGNNLKSLDSHIQKIALFLEKKQEVTPQDIDNLVYKSKKINVFDLLDAVCHKKVSSAITLCRQIFQNGIENQDGQVVSDPTQISLQITRLLHYQFKQLWQINIQKNPGKVNEYVKKKILAYAHNFDMQQLIFIWKAILKVEYSIKSSRVNPCALIEQTILDITDYRK